uniref:Erythroid differentiation-related factor 1 n=1 Tax=Bracon brevicornis TaxID=1563983 RepID=A0A6V7IA57_9HYME
MKANNIESHPDRNSSSYNELVKSVKSTAVVKYTAVQTPATFAQLQCNTNLNQPPSNWLSSTAESYGLQSVWSHNTGFTSFRMAHMFPDCVGEVDVVSDAENIKKLLKMPYSHGVVSMMAHRIENTLLLDDFDIHKYLLRQAETDWEWLRKFFYENIFGNADEDEKRKLFHKPTHNSRNTLQQKNLVSKFLYHSLVFGDEKLSDGPSVNESHDQGLGNNNKKSDVASENKSSLPLQSVEPMLPEPTPEDKLPDPSHNHDFTRNVVWTFENIQMLIGTDMPIFGGQTHPCISLRLRDMKKPINVLTGIDYWLDNLMSNVPEVVMCYHLDGIVQKYELIKTEDLPNLDNAEFSPKVIRDIAQNILSFLKNNATKAGHTYWLFKGKDEDVVKLYDLTSLCSEISSNDESESEKGQNPFTVPVAMLLYRVARNMKYSNDRATPGHQGTIRMLLQNCVKLLNREKYPQIVTSAHYMLSDLYIPAETDPAKPNFLGDDPSHEPDTPADQNNDNNSHGPPNNEADGASGDSTAQAKHVKTLMFAQIQDQPENEPEDFKYKPPPVNETIYERCQIALDNIHKGLECLKYFPINKPPDNNESKEDQLNMARPSEAIPMPYYSLNDHPVDGNSQQASGSNSSVGQQRSRKKNQQKKKVRNYSAHSDLNEKKISNAETNNDTDHREKEKLSISKKSLSLCEKSKNVETLPTWQAPKRTDNCSWKAHLKALLYEKAALVFAVLTEYEYSNKCYGASLRYILNVLKCQKILEIFCDIKNNKSLSYLLGRAGDCCLMLVQDWPNIDQHREALTSKREVDDRIAEEIEHIKDIDDINGATIFVDALESIEACLLASYKFYDKALILEPLDVDKRNLIRRVGNIHNELGVLYMNQASAKYQQDDNQSDRRESINWFLSQSMHHLELGIKAFEGVHDEANLALLHSNTGRLMRLRAHINLEDKPIDERFFYNKAVSSYQKALQVLETRKTNPSIWDTINWDLSTTLFTLATLLQDYPSIGRSNKNEEELEREVVEVLHKALKHCDTETSGARQPIYQFRVASIQHRLGSLYHRIYRRLETDCDSIKRKSTLQLSKIHYEKSAKLFLSLEQTIEYLTVQLERVALAEYKAQSTTTANNKIKSYQDALDYIIECKLVFQHLSIRNNPDQRMNEIDQQFSSIIEDNTINSTSQNQQQEEEMKLLQLLQQRLQFCLKSLTKLCLAKNNSFTTQKEYETLADTYKQCYSLSLIRFEDPASHSSWINNIMSLLDNIDDILNKRARQFSETSSA